MGAAPSSYNGRSNMTQRVMNIARATVICTLVVCASASMWDIPELIAQPVTLPNASLLEPKQSIEVPDELSSCNIQNNKTVCRNPESDAETPKESSKQCTTGETCDKAAHQDAAVSPETPSEETTPETTTPEERHFFQEEPVDEGRPDYTVPEPARLQYNSVAELAIELGIATEKDAEPQFGRFSSSNQRRLFKANSWTPLDGSSCKISTGSRVTQVNKVTAKVTEMMKKYAMEKEDQMPVAFDDNTVFHEFQTPKLYVEKTMFDHTAAENKYHILGYLDQSTRLVRINDDPQDVFIAKFNSFNGEELQLQGHRYVQLTEQASVGDVMEYTVQVPDLIGGSSKDMGEFIVEMTVESVDCTSYGSGWFSDDA